MADPLLRIAVIGAPRVGKTRFANALSKALETIIGHHAIVVDGYAKKLIKDTGFTLGHLATHSEDMMVAGVRMAEERKAAQKGKSIIMVGTPIESFVYRSMISDTGLSAVSDDMEFRMGMTSMEAASIMIAETYDYDMVFYIPVGKKALPWEKTLDDGIQSTLLRFKFPFTTINGKHDERISTATRVVKTALEKEAKAKVSDR